MLAEEMEVLICCRIVASVYENCSYEHGLEAAIYFVYLDSKLAGFVLGQGLQIGRGLSCPRSPYCKASPSLQ